MSCCLVSAPTSTLGQQLYVEADYTSDPAYTKYFARISGILETELPWELSPQQQRTGGIAPREIGIARTRKLSGSSFMIGSRATCGKMGYYAPFRASLPRPLNTHYGWLAC